jgi:hypothetical protein
MAHQITISWTASPGPISGYNVRRGTAAGNEAATPLNSTPIVNTFYTDNTVFVGQVYSYEVTAVLNGIESAESVGILSVPVPFATSPLALDFGAAASFAVLGASTVTNVPGSPTVVSGDVGVSPGTSITGFGAPASIAGVFHSGDFVAAAAQTAALTAFNAGMALPDGYTLLGDIGALTLAPGVYMSSSSLGITGPLVLDARGNPNAVWVFQVGSTLTTASSNSSVVLVGGAQADNVFWLVGSSATLNSNTSFAGNIIATASITVANNVSMNGRLIALTGAVTMNNDSVVLFLTGTLALYGNGTAFSLGQIVFDGQGYQEVVVAGTSGATGPTWSHVTGVNTIDGSVTWTSLNAIGDIVILTTLPPSIPNTPPAPPAAPLGLHISSES